MYKTIEYIAQELGCKRVRMTPSGWTHSGKTRKECLGARGCTNMAVGEGMEKQL